jgi:ribosomal protein S6--L-glutamate ligase
MRLTILSRSAKIHSTQRLVEAARQLGHSARVLNPAQLEMRLDAGLATITLSGKDVAQCDVVIPRFGFSQTNFGLAALKQFTLRKVPILNPVEAIAISRNTFRCLQRLVAHGVDVPATVMGRDPKQLESMVELVGGVPVLIKIIQGGARTGVMVCESLQSLKATLEAVVGLGQDVIVQKYVRGAKERDVRAVVVGGEVIAAVRRRAETGRFHRTLRGGARFERVALPPAHARAAVAAVRVVGLEVAAVDITDVKVQPKVYEVNSSPGLREIEQVSGVDVAAAIVRRAVALARASAVEQARPGRRKAMA